MSELGSAAVAPSAKQQIVNTAERLFAQHGIDGVPLRQIGIEAGMRNKTAVQYHFGSKDSLIQAILLHRLDEISRRRQLLQSRLSPSVLREVVEAQLLPVIELAEDDDCYYVSFLEQLMRSGSLTHPFDGLPAPHLESQRDYFDRVGKLVEHVPQPLRDVRIYQSSAMCLHMCADRHRARRAGMSVSSYRIHVNEALDQATSFLSMPPSAATLDALSVAPAQRPSLRALP